jgi:hypothetical protein
MTGRSLLGGPPAPPQPEALAGLISARHRGESRSVLKALIAAARNAGNVPPEGVTRADPRDSVYRLCRRIAMRMATGALDDPTGGATRWHRRWNYPRWARGRAPVFEAGDFLFYREED